MSAGSFIIGYLAGALMMAAIFLLINANLSGVLDRFHPFMRLYTLDEYPKLICHKFTGRLGNEMFQYASILAIAKATNRKPVFIGSKQLDTVLRTPTKHPTEQKLLEERCVNAIRIRQNFSCCVFDKKLFDMEPGFDYNVGIYLMSWKYFHNFDKEIRKALTFRDCVREEAAAVVNSVKEKFGNSTLVGVHVRRGDITREYNRKLGYPIVTEEFFNVVIDYFEKTFPDVAFVITSDDTDWCREHFPKGHRGLVLELRSTAVDLLVLSSLDHVALSFGSYSWWVGYLSAGQVVYWKDLFTGIPDTYIGSAFISNSTDYIYPGWIPL